MSASELKCAECGHTHYGADRCNARGSTATYSCPCTSKIRLTPEAEDACRKLAMAAIDFAMDQIQRGLVANAARGYDPTEITPAEHHLRGTAYRFAAVMNVGGAEVVKARVRAALDGD